MSRPGAQAGWAQALVLSCEHASSLLPPDLADAFAAGAALLGEPAAVALAGHRGSDPGAQALTRQLAALAGVAAPHMGRYSRLVVDLNRSRHHPRLLSPVTRALPRAQREALIEALWTPHRAAVAADVAARIAAAGRCIHVAVHSFTPVWDGVPRPVDLGLLYDPGRASERSLATALERALRARLPALRVRRNQPYRGVSDGLPTALRRQHPAAAYAGLELEVSQALVADAAAWPATCTTLAAAVADGLSAQVNNSF